MTPHDWKPTQDWSKGGSDVSIDSYLFKNVQECVRCRCRTRSGASLPRHEILRRYPTAQLYAGPMDHQDWYADCDEAVVANIMTT